MKRLVLLSLLLAAGLHAQDAATVARMVNEPTTDAAVLTKALQSPQALVRATAARVAMVRDVTALLPALRTQLASESDAEAARELVRAVTILGGDEDVAFVATQLSRFPASIDDAFVDALARRPHALELYLRHREKLRTGTLSGTLPYWRGENPQAGASRLLGAGDFAGFKALVDALTDSGITLDPGVATAALASDDERIRKAAVWHLARRMVDDRASVPASLRELATAPREGASVEERFGRELLRRAAGARAVADKAFLEWLGKRSVHRSFERLLTKQERAVEWPKGRVPPPLSSAASTAVETPFRLPLVLPRGLAPAILDAAPCKGEWLGVAAVTTDTAGRVQSVDTSHIVADRRCVDALATIARLSLATPTRIAAAMLGPVLVLRVHGQPPCFDEAAVRDQPLQVSPLRTGETVKAPKVLRRVEPTFPESVRQQRSRRSLSVTAEATITADGCVRDVRLVQQSPYPELNRSALEALAKWTFAPGTLDGVPVDVLFNLTIAFNP